MRTFYRMSSGRQSAEPGQPCPAGPPSGNLIIGRPADRRQLVGDDVDPADGAAVENASAPTLGSAVN